jgi:hypothetical protein
MLKCLLSATSLLVLAFGIAACADHPPTPSGAIGGGNHWLTGQIELGYYGGVGLHASAIASNFAQDFPFSVRLGLGYSRVASGDAWAARRVFINNNTNGTARSNARVWDARLDVLYPVKILNLKRTSLFAGPRHSNFDAYFEYIGGAETFDVKSKHWGLGGGIETAFALSPRVDLLLSVAGDYYFRSTLGGHDTYYRPNGDDTHPIDDYTYKDADAAIKQPEVLTRLMIGWAYRF